MDDLRLFISVNIDTPQILAQIEKFQHLVQFKGVKLVDSSLFHFSLHFLGDTSQELIPKLEKVISSIKQESFTVTLKQAGVFPSAHNIKVIWVGVSEGLHELQSLHDQLIQPLQTLNFLIESREFIPHLTIGRVKFLDARSKKSIQDAITDYHSFIFGSQEVTAVHLMHSTLTPNGPIYQSIFSKDL